MWPNDSQNRHCFTDIISYHHGVVTLLGFCRRYGVHYTLLSTCVGYFTCPGIDTQVQGTTVWSPLHPTVHLCGLFYLPWHRHSGTRDHGMEPLHPTVHLCGIFYLPWHRHTGTRDHGFLSHPTDPLFIHRFCMCPGRDRTRALTLLGLYVKRVNCSTRSWSYIQRKC
jgi:hypothetical protein